jgi:hypothetical protein
MAAALDSAEKLPEFGGHKRQQHQQFGLGYNTSYGAGVWDHNTSHIKNNNNHHHPFKWSGKERANECPWNKHREWTWRREKRSDLGDVEWVGGWQEAH